jgi:phage virion morphogenesis protein
VTEDLESLEQWAGGMLASASPAARRQLAREIGIELRRAQVKRIAAQRNPDGTPYVPRKTRQPLRSRAGRIKRTAQALKSGPMFKRLRLARFLGMTSSPSEVAVGFANATVARIASVSQYGLRDRVERGKARPEVTYPQRILLGVTDENRARILDQVIAHLQA